MIARVPPTPVPPALVAATSTEPVAWTPVAQVSNELGGVTSTGVQITPPTVTVIPFAKLVPMRVARCLQLCRAALVGLMAVTTGATSVSVMVMEPLLCLRRRRRC